MKIHYTSELELSEGVNALVAFDVDSIRQVVASERGDAPDLWLVAPEGYEENGHPIRDSPNIRLIAYSKNAHIVYATDGCNSCRHILKAPLETNTDEELRILSEQKQLPQALLQGLARLIQS